VTKIASTEFCTPSGITMDCVLLAFLLQHRFPRSNAVQMPQREEKTPQAVVTLYFPYLTDSNFTGVNPPKTFASVSKMRFARFARPSRWQWNSLAVRPSRLPRHSNSYCFMRNFSNSGRYSPIISESSCLPCAVTLFVSTYLSSPGTNHSRRG
jgi:hypothetical protein